MAGEDVWGRFVVLRRVKLVSGISFSCWLPSSLSLCSPNSIILWRTGREIPSFFILAIRVVRFNPS